MAVTGSIVLAADDSAALELGASVQDPPRQEPFGAEAWLVDPEGNRLLLLVPVNFPLLSSREERADDPAPAPTVLLDGSLTFLMCRGCVVEAAQMPSSAPSWVPTQQHG